MSDNTDPPTGEEDEEEIMRETRHLSMKNIPDGTFIGLIENPLALTPEEEVEFLRNQIEKIRVSQEFKDKAHRKIIGHLETSIVHLCETVKTMVPRAYPTDHEDIIERIDKILEGIQ